MFDIVDTPWTQTQHTSVLAAFPPRSVVVVSFSMVDVWCVYIVFGYGSLDRGALSRSFCIVPLGGVVHTMDGLCANCRNFAYMDMYGFVPTSKICQVHRFALTEVSSRIKGGVFGPWFLKTEAHVRLSLGSGQTVSVSLEHRCNILGHRPRALTPDSKINNTTIMNHI